MPHTKTLQEHAVLKKEIEKLAQFLVLAKRQIVGVEGEASASSELQEVVRHTEEATNKIMDKADAIIKAAATIPDRTIGEQVNNEATGILEACSFQDITGQRIRKVLKTLEVTEAHLASLIQMFGGTLPEGVTPATLPGGSERPDEALMRGPQLGQDTPSQEDIDKLFSSL